MYIRDRTRRVSLYIRGVSGK